MATGSVNLGWQRYGYLGAIVAAALVDRIDRDAGQSDEAVLTLNDGAQVHVPLSMVTAQHPNEGPFYVVRDEGGQHSLVDAAAFNGELLADDSGQAAGDADTKDSEGADTVAGADAGAAAAAAAATDGDAGEGAAEGDAGAAEGEAQSGAADGTDTVQGS